MIDQEAPVDTNIPAHKAWLQEQISGLDFSAALAIAGIFALTSFDSPFDILGFAAFGAAMILVMIRSIMRLRPIFKPPADFVLRVAIMASVGTGFLVYFLS